MGEWGRYVIGRKSRSEGMKVGIYGMDGYVRIGNLLRGGRGLTFEYCWFLVLY